MEKIREKIEQTGSKLKGDKERMTMTLLDTIQDTMMSRESAQLKILKNSGEESKQGKQIILLERQVAEVVTEIKQVKEDVVKKEVQVKEKVTEIESKSEELETMRV